MTDATASLLYPLFVTRAIARPEAAALIAGAESLTYAELEARIELFRQNLVAAGVCPGAIVGLCVERTGDAVAVMLALLSIGAAYLPLDPSYPPERLAYILEDSGVDLLVTSRGLTSNFATRCRRVTLEDLSSPVMRSGAGRDTHHAGEAVAYMMYTSGSTGRPKGTLVPQRAVCTLLKSIRHLLGITEADTVLASTSFSFDISVLELLLPLTTGACLVLLGSADLGNPYAVIEAMERYPITLAQATPSMWRLVLEAGWTGKPGLQIISGGERLDDGLAPTLLDRCSALWNMYGPTETTIWSTAQRVLPGVAVSVGQPLDEQHVYIVDEHFTPVGRGAIGELFIGGEGVTFGYHNRPELTAAKFVPDPFSKAPGSRMYQTGDLGRWTRNGGLEVIGRVDSQVKLGGNRIELGEIESILETHDLVSQAVVIVERLEDGRDRLMAYFVPRDGIIARARDLMTFLGRSLPSFMIPKRYIPLRALPLTPNFKVDRAALLAFAERDRRAAAQSSR